jgi:restriction system protein
VRERGVDPVSPRAWLVRAGGAGEREAFALASGRAVVGWASVRDLSDCRTRQDVLDVLCESMPEASDATLRNHSTQLWALVAKITAGDLVLLPRKSERTVAIGRVTANYEYVAENPSDARHTRPVDWLRTDVPRSSIGEDLLYSLGAFTTVCEIKRNEAARRFASMTETGLDPELRGSYR